MNMKHTSLMVWTACLLLLVLWLAGMSAFTTYGGLLHILLIPALVAAYIEYGRPACPEKVIMR
jgi:hypothetical protein